MFSKDYIKISSQDQNCLYEYIYVKQHLLKHLYEELNLQTTIYRLLFSEFRAHTFNF